MAYNLSPNATREFTVSGRRCDSSGRTRVLINCPFCRSQSWAYVWSLSGSGKRCEHKACGAMFTSLGQAHPVEGREHLFDQAAPSTSGEG